MRIQQRSQGNVKRVLRTSLVLGAHGVLASVAALDALIARRRMNREQTDSGPVAAGNPNDRTDVRGLSTPGDLNAGAAPAIDLARFDDEEFEAMLSGEWGVGWRMNERAINRRQVLARSLSEFLGSVEPEKSR